MKHGTPLRDAALEWGCLVCMLAVLAIVVGTALGLWWHYIMAGWLLK